jgi:ABC-2 type transport system ATP-binding protein
MALGTEVPSQANLQPAICNLQSRQQPLLLCQRVSKWYGAVVGVNQVTLELRHGITGLVGANGAGKSTLMRLITGHLRPDIGQVSIRGIDSWSSAAKRLVGYCPEVDAFYEEMSGRQFVEAMARLCGYPRAEARRRSAWALERVDMADRAERRLRGYSKGMRQRIKLAQALLQDPPLLVLDEPLSGIDPLGRAQLVAQFQELAGQGKCLLISSHELDELEKLTDHVAIMARGRLAAADTIGRIRERLANHPLTIRIDVRHGAGAPAHRQLAATLLSTLPDVIGVEVLDGAGSAEIGRLLVRARNTGRFFADLNRLAVEEHHDIVHLETLDDSTHAVLGYLLGRR